MRMQEQETNFLFLKEQGNNTLGTFMRKMVRGSLTEEHLYMCIIDCLSTIVFILPLHLDYTKVIILILWWRNFQLEYWRTFQLVSTALVISLRIYHFRMVC